MSEFIEKYHKNVIYGLLILIFLFIYLLTSKTDDSFPPSLVTNPPRDLANFVKLINDPNQNIHGVLLLAPNKQDKLVMLDDNLQEVEPCSKLPDFRKKEGDNVDIPKVPSECVTDVNNLQVFEAERQVVVLTPGRVTASDKNAKLESQEAESFLFLTDLDPSVKRAGRRPCTHSGGDC
jgi:hypothetical protein